MATPVVSLPVPAVVGTACFQKLQLSFNKVNVYSYLQGEVLEEL